MLLEVKNIKKTYTTRFSKQSTEALKDVSFTAEEGEFIAIMGESGSGKTTLLNLLALLDRPTGGSIRLRERDLSEIPEEAMAKFRRDHLGFVFQDFHLLDSFTLRENIALPLVLQEEGAEAIDRRVGDVAKSLKIGELLDKYPYEVSGGQKQRAAIARAMVTNPDILFADEPTGALDSNASRDLMNAFKELNEKGQSILMVTHSPRAAAKARRILFIRDGKIFHQLYRTDDDERKTAEKIALTVQMLGRA
ncbi:MAG: ABC transporter ATP-binding protein [Peptoniphilus sp.]|nr:ABC transporter ATP-binding protein [Peptoniphilus sp.]MDY6045122.1 ABC transporter ATP-binding protein [Peptoniphilus sp.]